MASVDLNRSAVARYDAIFNLEEQVFCGTPSEATQLNTQSSYGLTTQLIHPYRALFNFTSMHRLSSMYGENEGSCHRTTEFSTDLAVVLI